MMDEPMNSNAKDIIEAARAAMDCQSRVHLVGPKGAEVVLAVTDEGGVDIVEKAQALIERRRPPLPPKRRTGQAEHTELDSFLAHVDRFKTAASTLWADIEHLSLTAVYDYHTAEQPAFGEHRAQYTCPLSAEFRAWKGADRRQMTQEQFADFIEERLEDIASGVDEQGQPCPDPMDLLEMAHNLRVEQHGTYVKRYDKTTGEHELVDKLEAGEENTKIPRAFLVQLPIFVAGELVQFEARCQLRLDHGRPMLSFYLHGVDAAIRRAFDEVRKIAAESSGLLVFAGKPE